MADPERDGAESPDRLFVYGTLMRDGGGPAHRYLAHGATYVGRGHVAGRLYDLGRYPGAVPATGPRPPDTAIPASGEVVRGELYELHDPDRLLRTLDEHEGCSVRNGAPTEFYRAVVTVRADDGDDVPAWIYWYGWSVDRADRIGTGSWTGRAAPGRHR